MIIFHNISQLITLAGAAQRGLVLGRLGMLEQAAIACEDGIIVAVGEERELLEQYPADEYVDLRGKAVVPGFVDPHTHLIWSGDRVNEFEMRLQGKSYMEIMAAGGGILATLTSTRNASLDQLVEEARARVEIAFAYGTTTMEAKTGYGLDIETELRQLEAILELDATSPIDLVATYMGAHAIPPEYKGNTAGYTRFLCEEALPATKQWWLEHTAPRPLPFVDVFCEAGVFEIEETREILTVAKALGFRLKLHANEFENLGGASLAAELGAVSADHLVKTSLEDIARLSASETVAVSLPGTPFGLAQQEYTPAKEILAADGYLALATDLNPGTTWNESMQFIQALACRYLKLTPAQALAASTINAAKAVALQHKVGSIEAGKQADFLVLTTPDYRNLSYRYGSNQVALVVKKGDLYPNAG